VAPPPSKPTPDLILKVTPPRVPAHLVTRSGLSAFDPMLRDRPAIVVQAPAGFGKTSLLAQWRRELLGHGAAVAWLTAQPQDDNARLLKALALAVRVGAGRPTFGHVLLDAEAPAGLEGVTLWLAEVAQSALRVVLVVDEADHLPEASRASLAYLLHNAPPNLQCIVGARTDCDLGLGDLVAYGQCIQVGAEHLRFRLEETIALVRGRFGERADRDEAARLHEMAEGWPLGVQLALSVMGGARELPRLDLHGGALRAQFVGVLLANLDPADLALLTRVAPAEHLHPDMAVAMLEDTGATARLQRLVRETPIFVASDQGDWVRLHSLAAEALRLRFAALPEAERAQLHGRAADWLAQNDLLESAARHALAAGRDQQAYSLAERSLYGSMMSLGRHHAVLEWLAILPAAELERRPRLLLAAAWSLALSERHDEAEQLVRRLLAQPGAGDALRCECALILAGAAAFADLPDRFAELHDPWAEAPPLDDPVLLQIHANRTAWRTLFTGQPALARLRVQQAPHGPGGPPSGHVGRWGDFILALSYLWEGQVLLAEQLLRPALARAEADLGRRSAFATMLAALLAAAMWERDQPEEASALLANRLDVLERSALPECMLLGFRTLARIAVANQGEHHALELLGAMEAAGVARRLPRVRLAALADRVRLHARRFRAESCREACAAIDALLAGPDVPSGPLWRRSAQVLQMLAHGHAAIAAQNWRGALEPLAKAEATARELHQGRLHLEILGLRAYALDRCGERAEGLMMEAQDLAQSLGLQRVFFDAHPELGEWVARQVAAKGGPSAPAASAAPAARAAPASPKAVPSMALTPKERQVLELLARNLSNKEIGLALQVGEETIKWHLKNLFAKLDAGTRKQVVSRARILGLLADTA
jgi:LuxR family maltose regulon positive regulatory protein